MRTISILVSLAFVVFLAGNALAVNEEAVTVKAATPKEPAVSTAEPFGPPMILEQTGGTMECPPPEGTAKDGDQDGDGVDDWKLKSETDCDGNKVEIYCIDKGGPGESYFVYVYSGTKYVGKCPFEGGKNTFRKEKDGDGNWEETGWDSVDKGEEDDDGDGKEDDWH
ncbi:MAG: hypothetical protein ACE5JC_09270, partial [Candidatus Zixiibacteriota bacterium]